MASTLKDLRTEAGYKSARAFAEAAGIPVPTYSRYEQQPDKIPMGAARQLADRLGCSIDMVVGRGEFDASAMRGPVQRRYDALSKDSQRLVDEFLEFAEARDAKAKRARATEDRRRDIELVRSYERLLDQAIVDDPDGYGWVIYGGADERREAFAQLVEKAASDRTDLEIEDFEFSYRLGLCTTLVTDEDGREIPMTPGTLTISKEEAEELERLSTKEREKLEKRDGEVTKRLLKAYDALHAELPQAFVAFEYDSSRSVP